MGQLCPEVREIIEKKEKEVDDDFMAGLPRELREGESAISHVVGTLYDRPEGR